MEQEAEIRLILDPDNPTRNILAGMSDEVVIDERMVRSARNCTRLFPYIVGQVAENRLRAADPSFRRSPNLPPTPVLLDIMGTVRDELLKEVGAAHLYQTGS